jgi:glycosyltransferase involved in cell wall biosynthesis
MNGLDAVLEAASILAASGTHVRFLLIGDGPQKNPLMAAASARGLKNVEFRDPLPKGELAKVLASADAGMMLLRDAAMFSFAVSPNKLFDYLSAGIPVICNVPGETADLLASSRAGIQTRDTSAQALVDAVNRLQTLSPSDREQMGKDGRRWVAQNHSREVLGARLDQALREIVAK